MRRKKARKRGILNIAAYNLHVINHIEMRMESTQKKKKTKVKNYFQRATCTLAAVAAPATRVHTHTATPPYTPHKTHTRMQTQLTQFSWVWKLAFAHFEILSCYTHTHAYTCKPPHTHAKRTVRRIFDIKAKSRWKNTKYLIVIYSLTLPHTLTLPHSHTLTPIHSLTQSVNVLGVLSCKTHGD